MKKMFSKKFVTVSISILAAGAGIVWACAGDWEPDYANSNFTPEAFVDSSYRPFFYSTDLFYYGIGHDTEHDVRFNGSDAADWTTYLDKTTARGEIDYILHAATTAAIDSAQACVNGKSKALPVFMQSFQLFKNSSNAKVQWFMNYLSLAKKCEDFAVNNLEYSWDYESKKNKVANINTKAIGNGLLQGFTKAKDAFIKQRYWFQLVRFYFFNEPLQSAIDQYEQNEKQFTKNEMYYRTMAYAAGAYYKLKHYSKANYYYSKVYDGCAGLRTVAHFSFHPQEESDWNATLGMCANNEEKITLWQMLGIFYTDEKRAIQEIYALNSRSEKLELLLARAVNAQEQKLYSWSDASSQVSNMPLTGDTVNNDLVALVSRIAQAGNTSKPYMWQMAAGYLNMLGRNNAKAGSWLSMAEKKLPKDQLVQWQLRLLKLINKMSAVKKVDKKLENDIVADLQWLYGIKNNEGTFRYTGAFSWIKRLLAKKYREQQEFIKSVCFNNYPDFYLNNGNVEAMKSFLAKTGKSPYEQLCAGLYVMKQDDLVEYQAIRLAYDGKLNDAIAKMETITSQAEMPGNPFNGRIQDCHDCDHAAAQKIKYTKLALLKKMKEMDDNIQEGKEVYSNCMLLANAYYNITHYGNARAFYECNVLGGGHSSPFSIDSVFRSFLTSMTLATKYYTQALGAAKTDEQKAKCYFMLAKCERNQWYNTTLYNNNSNEYSGDDQQPAFLPWNGFKSLQQLANTRFYKEAINECGYFKSYIQSQH
jgi:hypothetical protein